MTHEEVYFQGRREDEVRLLTARVIMRGLDCGCQLNSRVTL